MNTREELIEYIAVSMFEDEYIGVAHSAPWPLRSDDYRKKYLDRAKCYFRYIEAAGCVVVPAQITDEMADAVWGQDVDAANFETDGYAAMLAASPFAPGAKP